MTSWKSYGQISLTEVLSCLLFLWQHWLTILPFFSTAFGRFVFTLSVYPSLLTLFHLKHKLPSLSRSLPGFSVLYICLIKISACLRVSICLWMPGFQPTYNIMKHSLSCLSILLQSQATAFCLSLSTYRIGIVCLKGFRSICHKMCYAEANFLYNIESCQCNLQSLLLKFLSRSSPYLSNTKTFFFPQQIQFNTAMQ